MTNQLTLGEMFARLMKAKNLKLIQVAEAVGRLRPKSKNNLGGLSKILNDKRVPSVTYLEVVAQAMNLSQKETVDLISAAGHVPPIVINQIELVDEDSMEHALDAMRELVMARAVALMKAGKENSGAVILMAKIDEAKAWVHHAFTQGGPTQ